MRVYVAGKFEEKGRVQEVQDVLKAHGHTVTFDWTRRADELETEANAVADIAGVREADALVVVMEREHTYRGTWVEVGAALISGKPVYCIGGGPHTDTVFTKHPLFRPFRLFPDLGVLAEMKTEVAA